MVGLCMVNRKMCLCDILPTCTFCSFFWNKTTNKASSWCLLWLSKSLRHPKEIRKTFKRHPPKDIQTISKDIQKTSQRYQRNLKNISRTSKRHPNDLRTALLLIRLIRGFAGPFLAAVNEKSMRFPWRYLWRYLWGYLLGDLRGNTFWINLPVLFS